MANAILLPGGVYQIHRIIDGAIDVGAERAQVGDIIEFVSSTGKKPTDPWRGFQFHNISRGGHLSISVDHIVDVLNPNS